MSDPAYSHVQADAGKPVFCNAYPPGDARVWDVGPAYREQRRYVGWSGRLTGCVNLDDTGFDFHIYAPDPLGLSSGTARIPPNAEPTFPRDLSGWFDGGPLGPLDRMEVSFHEYDAGAWELTVRYDSATGMGGADRTYPCEVSGDAANVCRIVDGRLERTGAVVRFTKENLQHNPACPH